MEDYRIPVSIVTGFLGSGKTSLINNIIKKYPGKKLAIIENEFGEIGIDGDLIVGTKDNIFEMSNGCICCSLNSTFIEVIQKLLSGDRVFNHLLIETTGIADPTQIVASFISTGFMQQQFRIDSVICLADASNLVKIFSEQFEIRQQICMADTLLLNKTDKVNEAEIRLAEKLIMRINPTVCLYKTVHSDIGEINILDTNAYSGKGIENSVLKFRNTDTPSSDFISKRFAGNFIHKIESVGISIPGNLDPEKFDSWMESFLILNNNRILRIKGILSFADLNEKVLFHSVRTNYVFEKGNSWEKGENRFSKLVFIGRRLDRNAIEAALAQIQDR